MKDMVHMMNAQTRNTMFNIRDVLADARRRDSEEIVHAVANSIPNISTNIIPAVQDMVSQMKDSIKVACQRLYRDHKLCPSKFLVIIILEIYQVVSHPSMYKRF